MSHTEFLPTHWTDQKHHHKKKKKKTASQSDLDHDDDDDDQSQSTWVPLSFASTSLVNPRVTHWWPEFETARAPPSPAPREPHRHHPTMTTASVVSWSAMLLVELPRAHPRHWSLLGVAESQRVRGNWGWRRVLWGATPPRHRLLQPFRVPHSSPTKSCSSSLAPLSLTPISPTSSSVPLCTMLLFSLLLPLNNWWSISACGLVIIYQRN